MSPVTPPIPLLLVADSAETCERIASALLSAPAFYRIERVTSVDLTRQGALREIPLALVDGNLHAMKQAQVVRQLNSEGMAVVALVDPRDVQNLQEVVLSGVASLVAIPFVDTQLWETVGAALMRGAQAPTTADNWHSGSEAHSAQGMIIAVYGPKGGSGTSVLSANLAVALQSRCERGTVLLEVGEGTGNQAVLLNVRNERTLGDLMAHFDPGDTELLRSALAKHSSGLHVLLAPPTPGLRVPAELLDEVVDLLHRMFDYVVVDCHVSARMTALAVIHRAHASLCVILPEMTALYHARQFVESVESTMPEVHLNVVLNRATMPSGVPADAIRRHLKMQIAAEIPDDPGVVAAAVNRGVPFVISHPRSSVSRGIEKLVKELTPRQSTEAQNPLQQWAGSFGRTPLRGRVTSG